jgi:His-Xaa-Ser system radical SAM maturase HxsB
MPILGQNSPLRKLQLRASFKNVDHYEKPRYGLLPFDFARLQGGKTLIVNPAGEFRTIPTDSLQSVVEGTLPTSSEIYRDLESIQAISNDVQLAGELVSNKVAAKQESLREFTGLHIFVTTLRCDHTCQYCQVSRRNTGEGSYDMSKEHAEKALSWVFKSPRKVVKIEFQGGESMLNFTLIKWVVLRAKELNKEHGKTIAFVIATNLTPLDEDILSFAETHEVHFSTSLDGPESLHNANRPRPGKNSYQKAKEGILRIQERLGRDRVSALMTTTQKSLTMPKEIVDEYLSLGLDGIFLRPLSPYGFAIKTKSFKKYDSSEWLKFYQQGLDYIIELNRQGIPFYEYYAGLLLKKMLSNRGTHYVDLQNPSGTAIGAIVFNYNGKIYGSDEGRMLAEMGNEELCLGHLDTDTYESVYAGEKLLSLLDISMQEGSPGCDQCAFRHWCGSDPAYHIAMQQDPVGHKTFSGFCSRNMGLMKIIIDKLENGDDFTKKLFRAWAWRR